MESEEVFFEIKDAGDFLRIYPIDYRYFNAENQWDRNWMKFKIEIKANAFFGAYYAEIMTTDLAYFRDILNHLYNNLSGEARFEDIEHYFDIHLKGDGLGHFNAQIIACANPGVDAVYLQFSLFFDQTQIPLMMRQLDVIFTQFPVK